MPEIDYVIYMSKATRALNEDDLGAILTTARERNRDGSISGMLIYNAGTFFQLLEGPGSKVDSLLKRISTDPRHQDLKILSRGQYSERIFSDWSMAFVRLEQLNPELFQKMEKIFSEMTINQSKELSIVNLLKQIRFVL